MYCWMLTVLAGVRVPSLADRNNAKPLIDEVFPSGLDSRYMISCLKPPNVKVLSLTTIATPHRGEGRPDQEILCTC